MKRMLAITIAHAAFVATVAVGVDAQSAMVYWIGWMGSGALTVYLAIQSEGKA